jgi:hypothetical protein
MICLALIDLRPFGQDSLLAIPQGRRDEFATWELEICDQDDLTPLDVFDVVVFSMTNALPTSHDSLRVRADSRVPIVKGRATVPTAALESAAIGIWTRDSQPNARRLCDSVNDLYLNLPPLKSGETRKKKIIMETRRPVQVRMTAFADGSPLPNCRIEVALESSIIPADRRRQAASAKSESMPRTAQKSTTDRSGTAEYEIEEFSTYAVSIEKNGFNPAYFSVDFSDGVAGTPMKVALHRSGDLVINTKWRNGIPQGLSAHAIIERAEFAPAFFRPVAGPNIVYKGSIKGDGTVVFDGIPSGVTIDVVLEQGGSLGAIRLGKFCVEEGKVTQLGPVSLPGTDIAGAVLDIRGKAVGPVGVEILARSLICGGLPNKKERWVDGPLLTGEPLYSTVAGPDGSFTFSNVPDGDWAICVNAEHASPGLMNTDARPMARAFFFSTPSAGPMLLRVEPGQEVSGRVTAPSGCGVEGTQVIAEAANSGGYGTSVSKAGQFVLTGLPSVDIELWAIPPSQGSVLAPSDVVIVPAGARNVDLELLESAATVQGAAVDTRIGLPVPANVTLRSASPQRRVARSTVGEVIEWRFEGFPAGEYDAYAWTPDGRAGVLRNIVIRGGQASDSRVLYAIPLSRGAQVDITNTRRSCTFVRVSCSGVVISLAALVRSATMSCIVPPGTVTLRLLDTEGVSSEKSIDLVAGDHKTIAL